MTVGKSFVAGLWLALVIALVPALAADKESKTAQVDAGSFGIYVGGKRMATETFSIHQDSSGLSTTSAQLKEEGASNPSQTCELKISSSGGLESYEWHELSPGKSELQLAPNNEFLIERVTEAPGDKPKEQPFLMPNTSVVLDNNFFVQREVLAWRYLASACTTQEGQFKCAPAQFGAVIPQERISTRVSIQPGGPENVNIHGAEKQLVRILLKTEDGDWNLWLDPLDHYKLIRVVKAGENTEIVRD